MELCSRHIPFQLGTRTQEKGHSAFLLAPRPLLAVSASLLSQSDA